VANVKITSYIDAVQREQDAITQAQHDRAMNEAGLANPRLDQGVAGAEGARPGGALRNLSDITEPPPISHPPTPQGLAVSIDWLNKHVVILGECMLELVKGHAAGPKKEGDAPKLNG